MNDSLDLAVRTRPRRENSVTLRTDLANNTACCFAEGQFGNSAVFLHVCEHIVSEKAQEALFRLARFSGLKENWDSYGAAVPTMGIILEAKRFVQTMDRLGIEPYFVSPGPNGEIMVEYRAENGREAQVHFNEDGGQELLLITGSDYPYEGKFDRARFVAFLNGR